MKDDNRLCRSIDEAKVMFRVGPGASVALLLCWWILAWVLGSLIILHIGGQLRLATVIQNIVMFILPAVMAALLMTSRPMTLLGVTRMPRLSMTLLTIAAVIVAIPFFNRVVAINEAIKFPTAFAGLEESLRAFEALADKMVRGLIGEPTVTNLIVSVLLIGILTGIAEETFFRGALQPVLCRVFRNAHAAIWVTAFIFSAMHMEFFGFVPRLLLGALLGYLVRWSGSLWLPILAHALNNSLVVICLWIEQLTGNPIAIGKIGEGVTTGDWLAAVVSLVVFGWLLARLSSLSGVKTVKDC